MQHEKSNNPSALHSKLQGLEQLPGEPAPDTAALWSRLEHRMERKPVPQRRYLLWAAACLLLVAVAATFLTYRQQDLRQVQQPAPEVMLPMAKSSEFTKPVQPSLQQQAVVQEEQVTRKPNRKYLPALPAVQQQDAAQVETPVAISIAAIPEMQVPTVTPPATSDVVSVEKPPARRLKVVHLNEIGKQLSPGIPAPPVSQLVARTSAPAYHEGRGSVSFSRNNSDDIIKINLSPTN